MANRRIVLAPVYRHGMTLHTLAFGGYRSLRDVVLTLGPLTVITGANGTGKSNLYRALSLLASSATGNLIGSLAASGGLDSVLWAGPEKLTNDMASGYYPVQATVRKRPVSLRLGFSGDEFGYQLDVGLPPPSHPGALQTAFLNDPEIKREVIWSGPVLRPAATLIDRHGSSVKCSTSQGWQHLAWQLGPRASVLDELADPATFPEAATLRRFVRQWRFYDEFRSDASAPARQPQVATYTAALASDGSDLAPAIQSIAESLQRDAFAATIDDAFPGSTVTTVDAAGRMVVALRQPGMLRPLLAPELSDGTMRYLMLASALLAVRPPSLMVLNEPETSLHPDLLPALGRLIASAAARCQVIVVTHSGLLIAALVEGGALRHDLSKPFGETIVNDGGLLSRPAWNWASR